MYTDDNYSVISRQLYCVYHLLYKLYKAHYKRIAVILIHVRISVFFYIFGKRRWNVTYFMNKSNYIFHFSKVSLPTRHLGHKRQEQRFLFVIEGLYFITFDKYTLAIIIRKIYNFKVKWWIDESRKCIFETFPHRNLTWRIV